MTPEQIALLAEFKRLVNMSVEEMQTHFSSPESDTVSLDPRVAKKLNLKSGKTVGKEALALKAKEASGDTYTDDDWNAIAGIVRKLKFQLARKAVYASAEGTPTPITLALRNRGHDPLKAQLSEAELTVWELERKINSAVRAFFDGLVGGEWNEDLLGDHPWTKDVFPLSRYAIVEWDGDLYRVDYTLDDAQHVVITPESMIQVEHVYAPVTITDEAPGSTVDAITEAEGEEGPKWKGIMIKAGPAKNKAKNGLPRIYTEEALIAGVAEGLFDFVPGNQVTDVEHTTQTKTEVAGTWQKAVWNPVIKAVENTFVWLKSKYPSLIHQQLKAAIAEGRTQGLPGFSITGDAEFASPTSNIITKILAIRSCDPISFPSAGGTITAITETTTNTRITPMLNALKALKGLGLAVPPKLAKQYEAVSVAEGAAGEFMIGELKAKSPKMFERDPDLEGKLMKDEKLLVNMFMTFMESQGVEPAADPKPEEPANTDVSEALNELAELRLSNALSASKLPETHQSIIRKSFAGRRPTASEITEAINEHRTLAETYTKKTGGAVSVAEAGEDKAATLVNDFFLQDIRDASTRKEVAESLGISLSTTPHGTVRSFREVLRQLAPNVNWYQDLSGSVAEAMDTTLATALLTNGMNARMVHAYRNNRSYDDWRRFATVVPHTDYQTKKAMAFGGFSGFAEIDKITAFPTLTESGATSEDYTITRRGGIVSISEIDIRNDNVGYILQLPTNLGNLAKRKKSAFVWGLITSNPTLDSDSKQLFVADHANLISEALSSSQLKTAIGLLQAQVHPNDTDLLGTRPAFLAVGLNPEMQERAYKLSTVAAGENNAVAAWVQSHGIQVLVDPHLAASSGAWYLVGDPTEIPIVEIGELDGRDEPEITSAMAEGVGSWFTNGDAQWRVKQAYNGTVVSYKGLVAGIPAA